MTFKQAVQSGIRNLFNIRGRASRSEFWWFSLCLIILSVLLELIFMNDNNVIFYLLYIVLCIASIPISIRRLHDVNKSAWWIILFVILWILFMIASMNIHPDNIEDNVLFVILGCVFIIWTIVLLVFFCKKGTQGDNRFGADPLTTTQNIHNDRPNTP